MNTFLLGLIGACLLYLVFFVSFRWKSFHQRLRFDIKRTAILEYANALLAMEYHFDTFESKAVVRAIALDMVGDYDKKIRPSYTNIRTKYSLELQTFRSKQDRKPFWNSNAAHSSYTGPGAKWIKRKVAGDQDD